MTTGSIEALLSDDLIARIAGDGAAFGLSCMDTSVLDRCGGHYRGLCYHEDPREGRISRRVLAHCSTCRLPDVPLEGEKYLTDSKVTGRVPWDEYFFRIARDVSSRSTCPRAAIGVVLVDRNHRIISTGYNGAPKGKQHCVEVGCDIYADHCVRSVHAERNAIDAIWETITSLVVIDPHGFRKDGGFLRNLGITPYVYGPRSICSDCARVMWDAGMNKEPKCRTE